MHAVILAGEHEPVGYSWPLLEKSDFFVKSDPSRPSAVRAAQEAIFPPGSIVTTRSEWEDGRRPDRMKVMRHTEHGLWAPDRESYAECHWAEKDGTQRSGIFPEKILKAV
jgi:hypothetical protein